MTKKKYKIGTCFGCQKCLYCGIDLIKETCECKKTVKPTKTNRTALVKNAFPRVFNPNSSFDSKQFDFIKNKNECFQYGYDLTKNIQLSFCSACNSSYQRLITKNTQHTEGKDSNDSNTKIIEASTIILDDESESEVDIELEINYKLIIKKADGTLLPAKNQSVTISELDEFLLAIQNNVMTLLKDEKIYANDYSVSFRSEKGQGAGTLLIDAYDFKNFCSEYTKLIAAKKTMAIYITIKKKELVKRKKKASK